MKLYSFTLLAGLVCGPALAQQARVNLDYSPQKNAENLVPFSAALHEALLRHGVRHEYYVGGQAGHDWATWRHLLYYRFLPGLWRADGLKGSTEPSNGPDMPNK